MEKLVFAPIDSFILLLQNMGKLEFPSPPRTDPQAFYKGFKNQSLASVANYWSVVFLWFSHSIW